VVMSSIVEEGNSKLAAGDVQGAKQIFELAHRTTPHDSGALLGLCRVRYRLAEWPTLKSNTQTYFKFFPANIEIEQFAARAETALRDWPAAAFHWERVASAKPDWFEAKFQLARALYRSGRTLQAAQIVEDLNAAGAPDDSAKCLLARMAAETGQIAISWANYTALAEINPARSAAEVQERLKTSDPRMAAIAAWTLIKTNSSALNENDLKLAASLLGANAARQEQSGSLVQAYFDYTALRMVSHDPATGDRGASRILKMLNASASDALAARDMERARTALSYLVDIEPNLVRNLISYGRVLVNLERWDEAIIIWRRALSQDATLVEGHVQIARALERSDKFAAAEAAWLDVLARDPTHAEALERDARLKNRMIQKGRQAITDERLTDAYKIWQDLAVLAPTLEETATRIGQISRLVLRQLRAAHKAQDYQAVLAAQFVVREQLPRDPEAQMILARAAMATRRYEIAVPAWKTLLEIDPANRTTALIHLMRSYDRLLQTDGARQTARELLQSDPTNTEAKAMLGVSA
jgi:tetratricopeptide (TPR) repeat protein